MAFLVSVSFHDGSGSPAAAAWAVAERGTSVDKAGSAAEGGEQRAAAESGEGSDSNSSTIPFKRNIMHKRERKRRPIR